MCSSLTSVVIPQSVTYVGSWAFQNSNAIICVKYKSQPYAWSTYWAKGRLRSVIWDFKVFYTDGQGITYALKNNDTAYAVAFDNSVSDVNLSNNEYALTKIYESAFKNCNNLASITIPDSITEIAENAFYNCNNLTSITFHGTPTTVYDSTNTIPSGTTIYCYADNTTVRKYAEKYGRSITIMPCKNGCTYEHVVDNAYLISSGSCNERSAYYKSCSVCKNASDTLTFQDDYVHSYTQQKVSDSYLKTSATCTDKAVYYRSCICGLSSEDLTFTYGKALGHTYDDVCNAVCNTCKDEREAPHNYETSWAKDKQNHWRNCLNCDGKTVPTAHVYSSNSDASCNVCAHQRSLVIVTYNTNGGSSAPSSQTVEKGKSVTISSSIPTRSGYKFQGWATTATGTVAYKSGATITLDEDLSLYAVWIELITVTYNANGGYPALSSTTVEKGESFTVSSSTPTRYGHTFMGWATNVVGEVKYGPGSSFTPTQNITLYTMWLGKCTICSGTGTVTDKKDCSSCDNGYTNFISTCYQCSGSGAEYYTDLCPNSTSRGGICKDGNIILNGNYYGKCTSCGGTGKIQLARNCSKCLGNKILTGSLPCDDCNGHSYIPLPQTCGTCNGGTWQKIAPTATAPAPILESQTNSRVVLKAVEGCEYSKDGTVWQSSPIFDNLSAGTHTFYQRYAQTSTTTVGQMSEGLVVKGLCPPGDINGDGEFDYRDVSKLYAAFRQKTTLDAHTDTDINGDDDFDYRDVSKLYAIFRQKAAFTD